MEQSRGFPYSVHIKSTDEAEQRLALTQHYLGPAGTLWEHLRLGLGVLGMMVKNLPSLSRSWASRVFTTVGQSLGSQIGNVTLHMSQKAWNSPWPSSLSPLEMETLMERFSILSTCRKWGEGDEMYSFQSCPQRCEVHKQPADSPC